MNSATKMMISAMRRVAARDASSIERPIVSFPFRASAVGGCQREIYFQDVEGQVAPQPPNRMMRFFGGHAYEQFQLDLLRDCGFEVWYPWGAQRGALELPDAVWTWDVPAAMTIYGEHYRNLVKDALIDEDQRTFEQGYHQVCAQYLDSTELPPVTRELLDTAQAGCHVDGLLRLDLTRLGSPAEELLATHGVPYRKPGTDRSATGLSEFKLCESYSFGKQLEELKDEYEFQIAVVTAALDEMAVQEDDPDLRVDFVHHSILHNSADMDDRDLLVGGGMIELADVESFYDVVMARFYNRADIDALQADLLPLAREFYAEKRRTRGAKKAPPVPTEIFGQAVHDKKGNLAHWKCKTHCPHVGRCHPIDEVMALREKSRSYKRSRRGF